MRQASKHLISVSKPYSDHQSRYEASVFMVPHFLNREQIALCKDACEEWVKSMEDDPYMLDSSLLVMKYGSITLLL